MVIFEASANWTVALGKTLLHSMWMGLFLLSLVKVLLNTIPGRYSNTRYRIATATLVIFVASVISFFLVLYSPVQGKSFEIRTLVSDRTINPFITFSGDTYNRSAVLLLCTLSSYLYLCGFIIVLIRSSISFKQIRGLKKEGSAIQGEWYMRFLQMKQSIGLRRNVMFLISKKITMPAIMGVLRPAILVPAGMLTNLSLQQVETILMHELYHLKRLDFLVNLIQLLIESLFFYNPSVWALSEMIRTERENCCDDRVIQSTGEPIIYARALFQLAAQHPVRNRMLPGALGANKFQLFRRLTEF